MISDSCRTSRSGQTDGEALHLVSAGRESRKMIPGATQKRRAVVRFEPSEYPATDGHGNRGSGSLLLEGAGHGI